MPLESDDLMKIVVDTVSGRDQRVKGPEADSFRKQLAQDVKLAEEKGWVITVPTEWEVE